MSSRAAAASVQFFTETYFPPHAAAATASVTVLGAGRDSRNDHDEIVVEQHADQGDGSKKLASEMGGKDALIIEIERELEPAVTVLTPAVRVKFHEPGDKDSILYYPTSGGASKSKSQSSSVPVRSISEQAREDGVYAPPAPRSLTCSNARRMRDRLRQEARSTSSDHDQDDLEAGCWLDQDEAAPARGGAEWRDPFARHRGTRPAKNATSYKPIAEYCKPVPYLLCRMLKQTVSLFTSPTHPVSNVQICTSSESSAALNNPGSTLPVTAVTPVAPAVSNTSKLLRSRRLLRVRVMSVHLHRHPILGGVGGAGGQKDATEALRIAYDEFKRCVDEGADEKLRQRLLSARKNREALMKSLQALQDQKQGDQLRHGLSSIESQVSRCDLDVERCRRQWLQASQHRRELLQQVVKLWRAVRAERKRSPARGGAGGASGDSADDDVRLVITRLDRPPPGGDVVTEGQGWEERDRREREAEVKLQVEERRRWLRRQYEEVSRRYKEQMRRYKSEAAHGGPTKRRLRRPVKPHPPDLSYETLYQEISEVLDASLRPPGEPKVKLDLVDASEAAAPGQKDANVKIITMISVRVLLDGVEACRATPCPVRLVTTRTLKPHLEALVDQQFTIAVLRAPITLSFEILETTPRSGMGVPRYKHSLGLLHTPPPELDVEYARMVAGAPQEYCFASTASAHDKNFGVVSGTLTITAGWDNPDDSSTNILQPGRDQPVSLTRGHQARMSVLLKDWLRQGMLDPNEPQYSDIVVQEEIYKRFSSAKPNTRHLGDGSGVPAGTKNGAHRLFRLDADAIWFVGPAARQTKCATIRSGMSDRDQTSQANKADVDEALNDATHVWDRKRHAGRRYLRRAYQAHAAAALLLQKRSSRGELEARESEADAAALLVLPDASGLLRGIAGLLRARRPLRPDRYGDTQPKIPSAVLVQSMPALRSAQSLVSGPACVCVCVARAVNVPTRDVMYQDSTAAPGQDSIALSSDNRNGGSHGDVIGGHNRRRHQSQLPSDAIGGNLPPSQSPPDPPLLSGGGHEINVRPFVVASYRGRALRTDTAQGCEPAWNQLLKIPLPMQACAEECVADAAGGGDCVDLMGGAGSQAAGCSWWPGRGSLRLQLYDERVHTMRAGADDRGDEVHQRITRHWLGGIALPLHCLRHAGGRLEGALRLQRPRLLLGYRPQPGAPDTRLDVCLTLEQPDAANGQRSSMQPAVSLCPVAPALALADSTAEPPGLARHLARYAAIRTTECPSRPCVALVALLGGRSVCATRLLAAVAPPPELVPTDGGPACAMRAVARFVSMIPIHENDSKGNTMDYGAIWLTVDKLLQLLHGSARDLAVLLCCYFLDIGVRATYLVLGRVLARGDSALVLTQERDSGLDRWFLWDPCTGQRCRAADPLSPLQAVYCVIGPDNIWTNAQRETRAHMTRWDMTRNARDWKPCFGAIAPGNTDATKTATKSSSTQAQARSTTPTMTGTSTELTAGGKVESWRGLAPAQTVQPQNGSALDELYRGGKRLDPKDLESRIHTRLVQRFEKWRAHRTTIWNRFGNECLAKVLPSLEQDAIDDLDSYRHLSKLQPLLMAYKVTGFPLNLPYTTLSSLAETVRATGAHLNDDPSAEFSLAVRVCAYPCQVASVWVFVAALVTRRAGGQ